ncbi:hypothetical protein Tco_1095209, partial [Tanacetum coccineum]
LYSLPLRGPESVLGLGSLLPGPKRAEMRSPGTPVEPTERDEKISSKDEKGNGLGLGLGLGYSSKKES